MRKKEKRKEIGFIKATKENTSEQTICNTKCVTIKNSDYFQHLLIKTITLESVI